MEKKLEVKNVVCDYGVYLNENLLIITNVKANAELIKEILEADLKGKEYSKN